MEEKDLNALLAKVQEEVKKGVSIMFDERLTDYLKSQDLATKAKELGFDPETLKTIENALKVQGDKINELAAKPAKTVKTLEEWVSEQIPALTKSKENKQKMFLTIPMTHKTVTVNSSITSDAGGYMIPGFEDYPMPPIGLQGAFTLRTLPANHHGIIRFTYQSTQTANGGMTAEGSAPTADVHAWTSSYVTVEKALAIEKISYESLNDVTELSGALQRLLSNTLWQAREAQLYNGNGSAPNIYGLYTNATSFTYAGWSGITTPAANLFDLSMLLNEEISRLYGGKFMPDRVCVSPQDHLGARWIKDKTGQYIQNPFVSADGNDIAGMTVVKSPAITAGTMMVGDSRYAELYLGDTVEIEIGYNDDDFKSDLVTMKARQRFAVKMSPNDKLGWYKIDNITAACAAISTVTA